MELDKIYYGDCMELIPKHIDDESIDMIFADLPFNTTNCKWDKLIPMEKHIISNNKIVTYENYMLRSYKKNIPHNEAQHFWDVNHKPGLWDHYLRIIKPNGAILLFAQIPFSIILGKSNMKYLKYEWIWEKTSATGHLNSSYMPMKAHENILVFYKHRSTYNPQKTYGHIRKVSLKKNKANCIIRRNDTDNIYNNEYPDKITDYDSTERFPRDVVKFSTDKQKNNLHKTQKPIELIKYMIKTYTNENDIILDNAAGSGTTGEGAEILNRHYILMENDIASYNKCVKRVIR